MLRYVKTAFQIGASVLGFLGLIALIGALNGDFQGLKDEPGMKGLMWLCNLILTVSLHIVWKYPDGVLLFYIAAVVVVTHLSSAKIDEYKREFDLKREAKVPRVKRPTQKRKKRR